MALKKEKTVSVSAVLKTDDVFISWEGSGEFLKQTLIVCGGVSVKTVPNNRAALAADLRRLRKLGTWEVRRF